MTQEPGLFTVPVLRVTLRPETGVFRGVVDTFLAVVVFAVAIGVVVLLLATEDLDLAFTVDVFLSCF
jgi:hypothetical protein